MDAEAKVSRGNSDVGRSRDGAFGKAGTRSKGVLRVLNAQGYLIVPTIVGQTQDDDSKMGAKRDVMS